MGKDNYISTAKGIGIILMVVGHAISMNYAYRCIYMFHMPLFFFCSGYFFKVPQELGGVRTFAWKRIKGLYWPFVKWGVVFLVLHNLFFDWRLYDPAIFQRYDMAEYLHRLRSLLLTMTGQEQLIDPFWFLKQLLLSSLLVCVVMYGLRRMAFRYKEFVLWGLLVVLTVVAKRFGWGLPVVWDLSIVFLSATFFLAGHIYRKVESVRSYSLTGFVVSFMALLLIVWLRRDYLDMLWYNSRNVLLYIPAALIGVYMTFAFASLIDRWPVRRVFYYLGNHTMMILALHLLVFKLGHLLKMAIYGLPMSHLSDFKIIAEHNEWFWLVYVALGCGVPLLLDFCYKYIKQRKSEKGTFRG